MDDPTFQEVFIRWEKLRLAFNGLLLAAVIVVWGPAFIVAFARLLVFPAIQANLFFCAGPIAEGYLCLFHVPREFARWLVFVAGCLIGVVVTYISLKENWIGVPEWP